MKKNNLNLFENILNLIPKILDHHNTKSPVYIFLDDQIKKFIKEIKVKNGYKKINFFKKHILWPNQKFGNVNSSDSFSLNQIIYYAFYYKNRNKYSVVADFGAHAGEDTLFMSKCGYKVHSFEPDLKNYKILSKNIDKNNCKNIKTYNKAISNNENDLEFITVKGNTLANHVANSRKFYGNFATNKVKSQNFQKINFKPNLIKINIEGYEKILLPSIHKRFWNHADCFLELHGSNAVKVAFNYCKKNKINIFSQKIGWKKVKKITEIPASWKDGCVFITKKKNMPW